MFVNVRVFMAVGLLDHLIALAISAQGLSALEVLSSIKVELVDGILISWSMSVLPSMLAVIMLALISQKPMTVGVSPMEHLVHHDVDDQSSTGSDEHHKRPLHVLTGNDSF